MVSGAGSYKLDVNNSCTSCKLWKHLFQWIDWLVPISKQNELVAFYLPIISVVILQPLFLLSNINSKFFKLYGKSYAENCSISSTME